MHQEDQTPSNEGSIHTPALPKVGIIGVGIIAEALVIGLNERGERRAEILLSPRNETISARLALRYPHIKVADDNQSVVDDSEIIVLAVRPQVTKEIIAALRFRPDQQIVSLIATFSVEQLSPLVAPANRISRAVPLPSAADREGPFTLFTQSDEVVRLFDGLGLIIRVENEAHLDLVSAATSLMATYFGMTGVVDQWLIERGFNPEVSRAFVSEMFFTLALAAKRRSQEPFSRLSVDYSTPKGMNEQAWRELRRVGWADHIQAALTLILDRIDGRATFDTKLS